MDELMVGFDERIEFKVQVTDKHYEIHVENRRQNSLVSQLLDLAYQPAAIKTGEGSNPNKSGSRPPGNMEALHIVEALLADLKRHRQAARYALGYDERPSAPFADVVCGQCGGALVSLVTGDVACMNAALDCGKVYSKEEWLGLLL